MAGTWTTERFPQFAEDIRRLTAQHQELEDEPLHLAISYSSPRDPQDVFLFEIASRFGHDEVDPGKELFETTFPAPAGFHLGTGQSLHLILTNPNEIRVALREGWELANEVRQAVRAGDYEILFQDRVGAELLETISHD